VNEPANKTQEFKEVTPVGRFSQCHAGIIDNLQSLGELPELVASAERARKLAQQALDYFDEVIVRHHAEEEQELFPAVLQSATPGAERQKVEAIVARLITEHRRVESIWNEIKPTIRQVARGHVVQGSGIGIFDLMKEYQAHANYEEEVLLPLSEEILGRNANHMQALGLSLHMRHARRPLPAYL
jgi:hemerythrin-like domain-containing protein